MKLSIIILNYKTKELTLNCINSIVDQFKKELEANEFEIIVVDNASNDSSVKQISNLKSQIPNLSIIESETNLGFSNGCNLGAAKAEGEYLLFLNSDTKTLDRGFVKMLDFMEENQKAGILGGKLRNTDGTSQKSAGKFYNLLNVTLMLLGFERLGLLRESPDIVKNVDWVSGGCLMIKKDVFEKLNGFNKELFMYMEDMDLCFRAKTKGFLTFFYPDINLEHAERGSSNKTFAILNIYKGILFFYNKYKPGWQLGIVKTLLYSKALVLSVIGKILRKEYLVKTYGQALELF